MTIKEYYFELQNIVENYYEEDCYEGAKKQLLELIDKAKEAGLTVKTTLAVLDDVDPLSSYESSYESSYDEDEGF
jgi:hypothetical protein